MMEIILRMRKVESDESARKLAELLTGLDKVRHEFEVQLEEYESIRQLFKDTEDELIRYFEGRLGFLPLTVDRGGNYTFIGYKSMKRRIGFRLSNSTSYREHPILGTRYDHIDPRMALDLETKHPDRKVDRKMINFGELDKILDPKYDNLLLSILAQELK